MPTYPAVVPLLISLAAVSAYFGIITIRIIQWDWHIHHQENQENKVFFIAFVSGVFTIFFIGLSLIITVTHLLENKLTPDSQNPK